MLRATLEEEMNSTTNALRQTFMTKIPTQEDIDNTCNELAQKLAKGDSSKNDVKIALVDILEEALQGKITTTYLSIFLRTVKTQLKLYSKWLIS